VPRVIHIHVEESDQGQPNLAILVIVVDGVECVFDGPEGDDLGEEIEIGVASRSVWEVCDSGGAWPADDTDEEDTTQDGTTDAVHHESDCQETAEEDTDPNSWTTENSGQAVV
jgi:hypothetical protein